MKVCRTKAEIRALVAELQLQGSVGLVPTMGALHAGHMALVDVAVSENPNAIATIFVNPTQFGNPEDLEKYPRKDEDDIAMLESAGVAGVFIPSVEEMYPEGDQTIVETTELANMLHGLVRPGHFRGVTTVVAKLFNITQADNAYFGKKDYQQLAVIRRMATDLHMKINIIGVDTVRDHDGLALSSRNVRLTPEHRAAAPILNQALEGAETLLKAGATIEDAISSIKQTIAAEPLAELQAIDIVNANSFEPASGAPTGTLGMMISALFGEILLIDQREVSL
ncbi:MAG: pantoate--beta-alanine ligase [Pseudomonadota bacterium]